jgi:hypothetical protein
VCGKDTAKGSVPEDTNQDWQGGELGGGLTQSAREMRLESVGAAYHTMAGGHQEWDICGDERDRKLVAGRT